MASAERVLFVHAHPDDESIATGGTIATLVDEGVPVTVLTCTRGEEGTGPEADLLAERRERELAEALRILGVQDHRYLGDRDARWRGGSRRYRGSARLSPAGAADSLAGAEFGEIAADIAAVIDAVHPTVVVSYDQHDRTAHPDHLLVAEAARRAADVLGVAYYAIQPEPASSAATRIDVSPVLDRKVSAIAAYGSRASVTSGFVTFTDGTALPITRTESYRRIREHETHAPTFSEQSVTAKVIGAVLALLLGAFVGAIATVSHSSVLGVGATPLPIGLLVSILLVTGLLAGLRIVFGTRVLAAAAAVGVVGIAALMATEGPGGSVIVANNLVGTIWAFAPVVVAAVVLGWPDLRSSSEARMGKPSSSEREPAK